MKPIARPSPALLRLLAATPALLGVLHAHAADQPAAKKEDKIQQVEIKGAATAYDARRNDTATKIVVTQEEILKSGDTTIGDVLKRLPGVTIGGVQGRGGDIRMRGLGAGYTQILLNGEPAPPGFSLDSIAPDMIERIEVMRAATAEFSTQAIAGGINIVLKRAVQTAQRELKVGLQDDNGKIGTNTNFQLSDKSGIMSYAIGGNFTYGKFNRPSELVQEEFNLAGKRTQLRSADQTNLGVFKGLGLSPRVNVNLGPGDIVTWQSFINANQFRTTVTERFTQQEGERLARYVGTDLGVRSDFVMARSDLTWTRKLDAGAKLEIKGGVNYNKRDTDAPSLQYAPGMQSAIDRLVTSALTEKGYSSTGKYATPIIEHHALAIGWDLGWSTRDEDRIQRETDLLPPPAPPQAQNLNQVYSADIKRLALYAQDEWQVTERWSVYLGMRWEGIETTSEGTGYAAVDSKSSVFSPLFQTLWKLPDTKNDQVRLGLSRTYKAPGVNQLIPRRFASNNNSSTSPDSSGNPQLKPELAWGLDLAYEHYLPAGGLLTASTYLRRIDNSIRNRVDLIDRLWVSRPVNAGTANTHGIELEAKLPLRSLYPAAPAIEVRANIARNWSTLDTVPGPNNRLDGQTPVSGTVGFDYKMDSLPVTTGASFSFQSGGPVRVSDKQFAWSAPKRTLDWYGLMKFSPKTQLRLSASNLLHQTNVAQNAFMTPDGLHADTTLTPTTAVVRALLEMKF
ncbi:MAG: TonB-dependent receptor [Burkholderiaceae bacterium]|nr:TonB-dependent receptor [Burkholderiaceae bacterium]